MKSKERGRAGVYDILDCLEDERRQYVRTFWSCVFQDHILQTYPVLRFLQNSLLDGSYKSQLPDTEEPNKNKNESVQKKEMKLKGKKGGGKRKKHVQETEEEKEQGHSSWSTPTQKKPSRRLTYSPPLQRGVKAKIWTWALYKTSLPVTCGDKKGTLHRDKLARGIKSILSERKWFAPSGFEKFAGKEKFKNWKLSIHCQKTPLQKLIQDGHLQCPRMKRQCVRKRHRELFPVSSSESSRPPPPLKREVKSKIWTWALYKTLPVTCGEKKGTLHRDKLARGIKSILSERKWFTPTGFEKFAGKEKFKNWKLSIRCRKTPLKKLIQEGRLKCTRMKRQCVRKRRRAEAQRSRPQSESSAEMEGSNEDLKEQRQEERENYENGEEEEESEPVDLLEFEAAILPVRCGSVTGDLYKNRFSGSRSKSIRTEERWLTPQELVKQEITDGHWKKDILCHGKTLQYLVEKRILYIHSLRCPCDLCCPNDSLAQNNDDVCFICDTDGAEDKELVCCDECLRAFHQDCHLPTPDDTDRDIWLCTFCVWKRNQESYFHMSLEDTLNSLVTQNIMRCEYLLLCLYKEDTQHIFTDNPFTKVPGYSSVITNPMWLNRVKNKLQRNKYSTVREFVDDIRLIFQNCKKVKRDNDFGMMGARLSEFFEQKFHMVFKIQ